MNRGLWWAIAGLLTLAVAVVLALTDQGRASVEYAWTRIRGGYTLEDRLRMHREDVRERTAPLFGAAQLAYPPRRLALLAFKDRRLLELWGRDADNLPWKQVTVYPILGMSGKLGPKLREGDSQVPEGIYRAEFLNANSRFHLSIRLNYPNDFDRRRGAEDGRDKLGSDIMIHGSRASIGCLAMGNLVAEDLFILVAEAGMQNVAILISPTDFRRPDAKVNVEGPPWIGDLYGQLAVALRAFSAAR